MEACGHVMEALTTKDLEYVGQGCRVAQTVSDEASASRSSRRTAGDPVGSSRGFGAEIGVEVRPKPCAPMRSSG